MGQGSYERLSGSTAGTALKTQLRKRAPASAARFQRAIQAARRALREPDAPAFTNAQVLWQPPPRRARSWPVVAGQVTNELFGRLTEDDVTSMLDRLSPEDRDLWERVPESERRLLAVHFCVHYGVPGVLERTGLSDSEPPTGVTAIARGSRAAGGSLYYADVVAETERGVGVDLATRRRVLDFGCSSGRVLRVLAAVHPQVEWFGCDPDRPAVAWADAHVQGAQFSTSDADPPLAFPDEHFDLVYAISIWSHYSEPAALRWLDEMRRIVAPGGHLLLTAHGYRSVERHAEGRDAWPPELIAETATRLYADGHKFVGGYGHAMSLELSTSDWGEAFLTPDWLAEHACPAWAVLDYKPGSIEDHQDLYLLERR